VFFTFTEACVSCSLHLQKRVYRVLYIYRNVYIVFFIYISPTMIYTKRKKN